MIIAVPVSLHDVDRIDLWLDVILKFGNLHAHQIHFFPAPTVQMEAEAAAFKIKDAGFSADVHVLEAEPQGGAPRACNVHFFYVCKWLAENISPPQPFVWMELDAFPVKANWADSISSGYLSAGAPCMGHIKQTIWRDDVTKRIVPSPHGKTDTMMCGVAVYPTNFILREEVQAMMVDLIKGDQSPDTAFDIWIRAGIQKMRAANSPMFDDRWNTCNYRLQGNRLVCDSMQGHEMVARDAEMISRGGEVSVNAAIVHGCKDGSLAKMILDGFDMSSLYEGPAIEAKPPADPRVEALEKQLADMREMMARVAGNQIQNPPQIQKVLDETPVSQLTEAPKKISIKKPQNDLARVVELVKKSPKSMRIDQIATQLDIPINRLKSILDSEDSPLEVKKPLGWVKLKPKATT